ncbi:MULTISPECIES: hypothetical protein [unclassified Xanthomonas]|uniref:hypothetical protein n=1 Tax=unclassified Xanthomonas TaxID=2643310 RepID=UPI0021DF7A24|nr:MULTISPECIES: hypothetical protein [unclassified Xanthomonas]UYC19751.1 hypothetical protein NUG20_16490 [Xanthomonas sp. CFBP 8443]
MLVGGGAMLRAPVAHGAPTAQWSLRGLGATTGCRVRTLATRLSQLPELEASYSGLELQVRLAAFRQQAFQALAQKCATAPNAAPSR